MALEGRVLVSFDALVYFFPNLAYLGESLRAGRIPLWNPDLFAGAPFLANPQTGVFYPPNWLTAVAPAPLAYSWEVVGHALLCALGAYVFGRRTLRAGPLGSLVTALVFAFGGFFSAQAVHLNQMAAAAWLPWLLVAVVSLIRRPRVIVALGGALVLALQVLAGHSQVVYLSAWTLAIVGAVALAAGLADELGKGADARGLLRWAAPRVGALALLGAVGAALTAPQLLPTLELSGEGIRSGGLDFADAASFSLPPWKLLVSLLPTFGKVGVFSEWVSFVGVGALALTAFALVRRPDRRTVALTALIFVGLLLALGKFTPLYELLVRHFPGFGLFRVPARWLLLYNVGVAGLAGLGLDSLSSKGNGPNPPAPLPRGEGGNATEGASGLPSSHSSANSDAAERVARDTPVGRGPLSTRPGTEAAGDKPPPYGAHVGPAGRATAGAALGGRRQTGTSRRSFVGSERGRWSAGRVVLVRLVALGAVVALALGAYQLTQRGYPLETAAGRVAAVWALTAGVVVAGGITALARPSLSRVAAPLFVALVAGELLVASLSLDLNRVNLPEAASAPTPEMQFLRSQPGLFRTLGISETAYEVGDVAAIRERLAGQLTPDEVYDYLVAIKHKETLTPNLPLAFGVPSLDGYDGGVLPLRRFLDLKALFPVEGNAPTDGRLRIQLKSVPDAGLLGWLNVRYVVTDRAGDLWQDGHYYDLAFRREVSPGQPMWLDGLSLPAATGLGFVASLNGVAALPGQTVAMLSVTDASGAVRAFPLRAGAEVGQSDKPSAGRIDVGGHGVSRVEVSYLLPQGKLVLRGLTALGAKPEDDRVVDLSRDYRLVYTGDTKIYENLAALPRAYFVGSVDVVADDQAAHARLASPDFDAKREAVVASGDWPKGLAAPNSGRGTAEIESYAPERVVVQTQASSAGLLLLTDAQYPGWKARVDGVETPIVRTNLLFRGVPVGAGSHRIELTYEPASFQRGLVICGAGVALGLAALAAAIWRRRAANSVDYPSGV